MWRVEVLRKKWGLPVYWDASDDAAPVLTAAAETVPQVTVNHFHGGHHLHLTHGGDAAGLGLVLPPGSTTATEEEN
jgi:hypothetical protein